MFFISHFEYKIRYGLAKDMIIFLDIPDIKILFPRVSKKSFAGKEKKCQIAPKSRPQYFVGRKSVGRGKEKLLPADLRLSLSPSLFLAKSIRLCRTTTFEPLVRLSLLFFVLLLCLACSLNFFHLLWLMHFSKHKRQIVSPHSPPSPGHAPFAISLGPAHRCLKCYLSFAPTTLL